MTDNSDVLTERQERQQAEDDRQDRLKQSRARKGRSFFSRDDDEDDVQRPRTGARRSVTTAILQLPKYFRLLGGLITDDRVSKWDKLFVIGALAYLVSPIDFIPDFIPFFGEVDDVFLVMLALQRLVNNAGRSVLLSHWSGDPDDVHHLNFARIVSAAGFFLPSAIKRRLFKMAGMGKKRRR